VPRLAAQARQLLLLPSPAPTWPSRLTEIPSAHGTPLCQGRAEVGFRLWSGGSGMWLVRKAGVRGQGRVALIARH
jgi:hypothetical protein